MIEGSLNGSSTSQNENAINTEWGEAQEQTEVQGNTQDG